MALLPVCAAFRVSRGLNTFGLAGLALVLLGRCTLGALDGTASQRIAYADNLRLEMIHVPGEPASGERDSLPNVVYTGRHARIAVTLTDSENGVPVAGAEVAGKIIATTWIGPTWRLEPTAPESPVHEGEIAVPTHGPYRIDLEVEVPGGNSAILFGFDY
jgi:hypothetical protein